MAGERTILRVYLNSKNKICYELMTHDNEIDVANFVGKLEFIKKLLLEDAETDQEEMTDEQVDETRDLLDGEDDAVGE